MLDGLVATGALGEFLDVAAEQKAERELWQMYLVAPREETFAEFSERVRPRAPQPEPDARALVEQTLAIAGIYRGGDRP